MFGPSANGRPAADFRILLLDLWCAPPCNQGPDVVLESSEGNEVAVGLRLLAYVALQAGYDGIRIICSGNRQLHLSWMALPCS